MKSNNYRADCREIEVLIPSKVKDIRSTLQDKYGVIVPDHCNDFVARCLRMKEGNEENAIKLVKAFYDATANFKTWDASFQPGQFETHYLNGALTTLQKRDSSGRIIFVGRLGLWDCNKLTFDQAVGCIWMMIQYITAHCADAQKHGFVTIWDFSGFTMKHAMAINKWRLVDLAKIGSNGVAGRIKQVHAINHPRIVSILYSGVRPFLKEKLRKRVFFHGSRESLFSKLDKDSMPESIGGNLDTDECTDTALMKEFLCHDKYFIDMMNDRMPSK